MARRILIFFKVPNIHLMSNFLPITPLVFLFAINHMILHPGYTGFFIWTKSRGTMEKGTL